MPASTYEPLSSVTLTTAQSQVTFANIPQNYTDLILIFNGAVTTGAANITCVVNNSGTDYSRATMSGNASIAFTQRYASQSLFMLNESGFLNTTFSNVIAQFMNYSNATTFKTMFSRPNNADNGTSAVVNTWRNKAPINSITISASASTFVVGSTFSLYAVGANSLKATGGDIIQTDGTYWYHAFTSSGVFTPLSTLSCDALVIAGGGGGTNGNWGGGSGAGGLRSITGVSLSTATTVTVGAGGTPMTNGSDSIFSSITSTGGGIGGQNGGLGTAGGSGGGASGYASAGTGAA